MRNLKQNKHPNRRVARNMLLQEFTSLKKGLHLKLERFLRPKSVKDQKIIFTQKLECFSVRNQLKTKKKVFTLN